MKKIILSLALAFMGFVGAYACTSAIISGRLTENGRPLLWKNRDTSDLNNKVEKIDSKDGNYAYVAVFNGSDTDCKEAWIGFNSEGFAIMNTASYNLKDDDVKEMDKEGLVMSRALASCRTVDDFERLLAELPKPLGVEANFGVIDAEGNAAYFETDNWKCRRFDVDDTEKGYIVRTNYSKSGRKDEGYGYIREENAETLLAPYIAARNVTPAVFTEGLSRSFYHSLMGKDMATLGLDWVVDRDFIPRMSTAASVVIEGVLPGESPELTTMWTVLGYPPCGVMEPVWMWDVPADLRADKTTGRAPACECANERKAQVFSLKRDHGENYLRISALFRADGKGISQLTTKQSIENYKKGYEKLEQKRKEVKK